MVDSAKFCYASLFMHECLRDFYAAVYATDAESSGSLDNHRWLSPSRGNTCNCSVNHLLSLLVGGLGVFGKRPRGRTLLLKVILLAMILECLRIALYVVTQLEMLPIMEEYMPKMMSQAGSKGPSSEVFGTMMRVMTFVGLGLWVTWGLVKLGLYACGRSYLKKPPVIDYYNAFQNG